MLIDYPYFAYCGISYVRTKGLLNLKNNFNKYVLDLIGNEEIILKDYEIELRNTSLELIADSFRLSLFVTYNDREEVLGSGDDSLKIEKSGNSFLILTDTEFSNIKKFEGS